MYYELDANGVPVRKYYARPFGPLEPGHRLVEYDYLPEHLKSPEFSFGNGGSSSYAQIESDGNGGMHIVGWDTCYSFGGETTLDLNEVEKLLEALQKYVAYHKNNPLANLPTIELPRKK